MPLIGVITEADLDAAGPTPAQKTAGQVLHINALSYVRLRLRLKPGGGVSAVAARLWYYRDGDWWPLRGDGAGAGAANVTADPATFLRRAEGYYSAQGLSHEVVVVAQSGTPADVAVCYVEPCESLP